LLYDGDYFVSQSAPTPAEGKHFSSLFSALAHVPCGSDDFYWGDQDGLEPVTSKKWTPKFGRAKLDLSGSARGVREQDHESQTHKDTVGPSRPESDWKRSSASRRWGRLPRRCSRGKTSSAPHPLMPLCQAAMRGEESPRRESWPHGRAEHLTNIGLGSKPGLPRATANA